LITHSITKRSVERLSHLHFSSRKLGIGIIIVLCSASFGSLFISTVKGSPSTWSIETVDAAANVGYYTSIAVDSTDQPHISYHDNFWFDLKYATWTGSAWYIEPVDTVGSVGYFTSIAIDSADQPHISYIDYSLHIVKHAVKTDSAWTIEPVVNASLASTSIALDSADQPHISYETYSGYLGYTKWTGSTWSTETVDNSCIAIFSSLALDSLDRPRISYYDDTSDDLKYAMWTGSEWSIETVDSSGDVGRCSSLALDSTGLPHISYWDNTNANLKYAMWTGSEWSIETVDAAADVGDFSSIALASNDMPHISYYDEFWFDLKYARWTGSAWSIEPVDTVGNVGAYCSIVLDSGDHPHFSYIDGNGFNLKYARAPNEYFYDVSLNAFDSNGDAFWDAVQVDMDVDTTYNGSLNVLVYAYLKDPIGSIVDIDGPSWSITHANIEWGQAVLHVPSGSPEGLYDVELYLFDADNNNEDYLLLSDEVYLYPPDMRELTIEVEGSGTTDPAPGSWWVTNGTVFPISAIPNEGWRLDHWLLNSSGFEPVNPFEIAMDAHYVLRAVFAEEPPQTGWLQGTVTDIDTDLPLYLAEIDIDEGYWTAYTNATGQYSIELSVGEHEVTVYDSESSIYTSQTVNVTIVGGATTTQDFQLARLNWVLGTETVGSGTTDPSGPLTWPKDTYIEVGALPAAGWRLLYWLLDSVDVGSENPIQVWMDADHNLTAVFGEESQIGLLQGTVVEAGTSSPIEAAEVSAGSYSVFTDAMGNFEMEMLAGEYNVTAQEAVHFSQTALVAVNASQTTVQDFTLERSHRMLTLEVEGAGSANLTQGTHPFLVGSGVVVEAFPNASWTLSHWILDSVNVGSDNPISVLMDSDHVLRAVFTETVIPEFPSLLITLFLMVVLLAATLIYETKGKRNTS
jgi:hypothetical protein